MWEVVRSSTSSVSRPLFHREHCVVMWELILLHVFSLFRATFQSPVGCTPRELLSSGARCPTTQTGMCLSCINAQQITNTGLQCATKIWLVLPDFHVLNADSISTLWGAATRTSPSTLIPGWRRRLLWGTASWAEAGAMRRGSSISTLSGRASTLTWVAAASESRLGLYAPAWFSDRLSCRCQSDAGARSTRCLSTGNTCVTSITVCATSMRLTSWRFTEMWRSATSTSEMF